MGIDLLEKNSTQAADYDQSIDNRPGEFEFSGELLEVMEEFAATPMIYERDGEVYYAEGSYDAVQLCPHLQNDKLPASLFRRNFTAAAVRRAELDAEKMTDDTIATNDTPHIEQADVQDSAAKTTDVVIENKSIPKSDSRSDTSVIETSTESTEDENTIDVSDATATSQLHQDDMETRIPVLKVAKSTYIKTDQQRHAEVTDAGLSKKSASITPKNKAGLLVQRKVAPIPNIELKKNQLNMDSNRLVEEAVDPVILSIEDRVVPHKTITTHVEKTLEDITRDVVVNKDESIIYSPVITDDAEAMIESDKSLSNHLEPTFSNYFENIQDDEDNFVIDNRGIEPVAINVDEGIYPKDQFDTVESDIHEYEDAIRPEIIIELNYVLEHFAYKIAEEERQEDSDITIDSKDHEQFEMLDNEHIEALYQCLEAQIEVLTEDERTVYSETSKLPRQIEVTLETFFEEIGIEDTELATRLYLERYGVNHLLDIIVPISAKKTKIATALSERYHRIAQFVTSMLHDDGKHARANSTAG